jgi:polyhydroxyalkanoate synthase
MTTKADNPESPDVSEFAEVYQTVWKEMMAAGNRAVKSSETLSKLKRSDVQIAETPADVVFQVDKVTLSRYRPLTDKKANTPPIIICYGLFGRQTMIDLQEDRSLVRHLLNDGIDVYVIDWGNPTRADQFITLDDIILGYLRDCVEYVVDQNDGRPVSMFGICEGGTFAACLAALEPELFSGLALAITPIDFEGDSENFRPGEGFLNSWTRHMSEEDVNSVIDTYGNMPGELTGAVFSSLTPIASMTKYNLGLARLEGDEDAMLNFLRMEKWISDRPDHPGAAAKQWFNELYRENRLVQGKFELDGRKVNLGHISVPVLNIYAEQDHIVPVSCTKPLGDYIRPKLYQEIGFPGGHVGVFVSRKAQGVVAGGLSKWLIETQAQDAEPAAQKTPAKGKPGGAKKK